MPFTHAEGCSAYLEYDADSDGAEFCPGAIDANSDAVDAEEANAVEAFCSGNGHCYMSQFNDLKDPYCSCDTGFYGTNCSQSCPVGSNGEVCSGYGACDENTGECFCNCGHSGDTCDDVTCNEDMGYCKVKKILQLKKSSIFNSADPDPDPAPGPDPGPDPDPRTRMTFASSALAATSRAVQ